MSFNKKMIRRIIIACIGAIVITMGAGCAGIEINYDLTKLPAARSDSKRQAMRVAVVPLQDMRPAEEKNPPFSSSKGETRDKMFKDGDVAGGISQALVTHFNYVQLFKSAKSERKFCGNCRRSVD